MAGRFSILTDENTARGIAKALIDHGWDVGEVVKAIEALAQQDDPFAYPIVYLKPRK